MARTESGRDAPKACGRAVQKAAVVRASASRSKAPKGVRRPWKSPPVTKPVAKPAPLDQRFERVSELGRGACGVVWLVRRKADRKLLAMKTLALPPLCSSDDKDILDRRQALREVEILRELKSPYLVQYVDAVLQPASTEHVYSELHIFTEYCDAGDLGSYIRKIHSTKHGMTEAEVWGFLAAILQGLADLHNQRILHRDLKPANIFLRRIKRSRTSSPGRSGVSARSPKTPATVTPKGFFMGNGVAGLQVLLGDFGLARAVTDSMPLASTLLGTPHFMAPEIFEGKPYDEKADIYAFGVCIYELMHGCTPFADVKNMAALVRRVVCLDTTDSKVERDIPVDQRFSVGLRSFVLACLKQTPEERPVARELRDLVPAWYRVPEQRDPSSLLSDVAKDISAQAAESDKTMLSSCLPSPQSLAAEPGCPAPPSNAPQRGNIFAFRPPGRAASATPNQNAVAGAVPEACEKVSALDTTEITLLPSAAADAMALELHHLDITTKPSGASCTDSGSTGVGPTLLAAVVDSPELAEPITTPITIDHDEIAVVAQDGGLRSEAAALPLGSPPLARAPPPSIPIAAADGLTVTRGGHCERFLREHKACRGRSRRHEYVAQARELWSRWRKERQAQSKSPNDPSPCSDSLAHAMTLQSPKAGQDLRASPVVVVRGRVPTLDSAGNMLEVRGTAVACAAKGRLPAAGFL